MSWLFLQWVVTIFLVCLEKFLIQVRRSSHFMHFRGYICIEWSENFENPNKGIPRAHSHKLRYWHKLLDSSMGNLEYISHHKFQLNDIVRFCKNWNVVTTFEWDSISQKWEMFLWIVVTWTGITWDIHLCTSYKFQKNSHQTLTIYHNLWT